MRLRGIERSAGIVAWALLCAAGCSSEEIVVGERCPHPSTGEATVVGGEQGTVYGTGCAPCDKDPEFDERGCPVLVTFESCGGNICIGSIEISPSADAGDAGGAGDAGDAGAGDDAGAEDGGATEDGGAD